MLTVVPVGPSANEDEMSAKKNCFSQLFFETLFPLCFSYGFRGEHCFTGPKALVNKENGFQL